MNEPLISYKIVSSDNFSSFERPASDAMSHIRKYMQDNSAWLYIDGQPTDLEDVRPEMLGHAASIVVCKVIMGG